MAKREMKTQNVEETLVEQEVVEEATPVVEEKKTEKKGSVELATVVGCSRLNIRKEPKKDADVVSVIDAGSEIKVVDRDKHQGEWYKVITADKTKGFCMKQYIKIK